LILILFIEKTWFLWWMLTIAVALRWLHLQSMSVRMEGSDARDLEEEGAYILSWRIFHKEHVISLFGTERAH
jgi:hypothetical protein